MRTIIIIITVIIIIIYVVSDEDDKRKSELEAMIKKLREEVLFLFYSIHDITTDICNNKRHEILSQ